MTASDPTLLSQPHRQVKTRHGTHELTATAVARLRAEDEQHLHSEILRHMARGIALIRVHDSVMIYVNPRLAQMLGYTLGEITGQNVVITRPTSAKAISELTEQIAAEINESGSWTGDIEVRRKDGCTFWCHSTVSRFECREHGQLWLSIHEDITERRRAEDALHAAHALLQAQMEELRNLHALLHEQAIRDPLTQLYNRRYLHDSMPSEIARAARHQYDLAILMIDIDHFKRVNDTYGHTAGDATLQAVAGLIMANLRASDIACRYGGEEILCMLMGASEETALRRADDLRALIADLPVLQAYPEARVTVSIGVAITPACNTSMVAVIRAADQALYRAKSEGRNCVRLAAVE